ncbi:hypothetical protein QWY77_03410 [Thalassotalea ponticola]|uniref:hypothetical protein n=1 Tax=Thalassotalea ponticola TaxID=1523392 RepID=UPI0025B49DA8|nr:hypothetical protein [Thalassotalea ponticola]MDN3651813.1 hypothetical protein [Thalassotalea ponticola]
MKKIIVTGMEQPEFREIALSLNTLFNADDNLQINKQLFTGSILERDKEDKRYILLYTSVECYLASKFKNQEVSQTKLADAIDYWMECHSQMLHFYNRNSDRAILVNIEAIGCSEDVISAIDAACNTFAVKKDFSHSSPELNVPSYNEGELSLIKTITNLYSDEPASLYADMEAVANINREFNRDNMSLLSAWNFINESVSKSHQFIELESQIEDLENSNSELKNLVRTHELDNETLYSNLHALQIEIEELNIKLHSAAANYHGALLQKDDEIKSIKDEKLRVDKQVTIKSDALEETRKELRHVKWLNTKLEQENLETIKQLLSVQESYEKLTLKVENDAVNYQTALLQKDGDIKSITNEKFRADKQVTIKSEALEETRKELRHFKWLSNKLQQENEESLKQLLLVQEKYEELFEKKTAKQTSVTQQVTPIKAVNTTVKITPLTNKQRKLRKLRTRPVMFITDAVKNKIQPRKIAS